MAIRGMEKTSLVDFPGHICTTVFFGGCNYRCPWCHNGPLVLDQSCLPELSMAEVLELLQRRSHWVQAVCLTGGEPTLEPNLLEFVQELKRLGFLIKLDTNGSQPKVLGELLQGGLLDYIAMDIKAPPGKYQALIGTSVSLATLKQTIGLIQNSGIPYEFRTTVVPDFLEEEDLLAVGDWLSGSTTYVLQQFRPQGEMLDGTFCRAQPYPEAFFQRVRDQLRGHFQRVELRV